MEESTTVPNGTKVLLLVVLLLLLARDSMLSALYAIANPSVRPYILSQLLQTYSPGGGTVTR